MSKQTEQPKKEEQKVPPPTAPVTLPSDTFTAEATSTPGTGKAPESISSAPQISTTAAVPEKRPSPKLSEQQREEKVKQARALLDSSVKQIAKKENMPENLV